MITRIRYLQIQHLLFHLACGYIYPRPFFNDRRRSRYTRNLPEICLHLLLFTTRHSWGSRDRALLIIQPIVHVLAPDTSNTILAANPWLRWATGGKTRILRSGLTVLVVSIFLSRLMCLIFGISISLLKFYMPSKFSIKLL